MINRDDLKELIKQCLREVIKEERLKLYEAIIPTVSKKEMEEIINNYGSPDKYKEENFEDISEDWLRS